MTKFFRSLREHFFVYIATVLIAFAISFYAIGLKVEPKDNQKFRVMVNDYNINLKDVDYKFSENIIKYETISVANNEIATLIAAQKDTSQFDLLIVCESIFNEKDFAYSLLPLSEDKLDSLIPLHSKEYINKEDKIYGFKITEKIKKYSQVDLVGEYFCCFFLNSVHSGELNSCSSDESIRYVNWLLS